MIVRHLTGEPPDQAARATAFLSASEDLRLADLIVAEIVYVLASVYSVDRAGVVDLVEAIIAFPAIRVADPELLLRALEVYERDRLDFAEAYLVALSEVEGMIPIASFDPA